MKHIVFFVTLGLALPVFGQAEKPAAPKAEPKAEAKAKPAMAKKMNPKRQEDARHCLDRPTNTEIIKCAEEYL